MSLLEVFAELGRKTQVECRILNYPIIDPDPSACPAVPSQVETLGLHKSLHPDAKVVFTR